MKKLVILALLALILGGHIFASAALYDRGTDSLGNHLIYDSGLNITWYDYSNSYNTWQNQVNWAVGLTVNFEGNIYDDWRLPTTVDGPLVFGWDGTTTAGHNITSSEMGHLFYTELGNKGYYDTNGNYPQPGWGLTNKGPFQHLEAYWHWSGTEGSADPDNAWFFAFRTGYQGYHDKGNIGTFALAVRPGDVTAVPIPGAIWLLGSGLIGLVGLKRKIGSCNRKFLR